MALTGPDELDLNQVPDMAPTTLSQLNQSVLGDLVPSLVVGGSSVVEGTSLVGSGTAPDLLTMFKTMQESIVALKDVVIKLQERVDKKETPQTGYVAKSINPPVPNNALNEETLRTIIEAQKNINSHMGDKSKVDVVSNTTVLDDAPSLNSGHTQKMQKLKLPIFEPAKNMKIKEWLIDFEVEHESVYGEINDAMRRKDIVRYLDVQVKKTLRDFIHLRKPSYDELVAELS